MNNQYKLYCKGRNFSGEAIYNIEDKDSILVLKGSKIVGEEPESFRRYYSANAKIKDELIEKGIIVDDVFTEDYRLSPFQASSIISGYGRSGGKSWQTKDGRTIEDLEYYRDNLDSFIDYYNQYELGHDLREKTREDAESFKKSFPLESIREMSLEDYDRTGSRDSFAYLIEHGTNNLAGGFLGSNYNKLVYNIEADQYGVLGRLKNKYPDKSVDEIFEELKKGIYYFIRDFDRESYDGRDVYGLLSNTNTIRSKLIMIYRYGEVLHLSSKSTFTNLYDYFGLNNKDMDSLMMNIRLKDYLLSLGLEDDNEKLSRALWNFNKKILNENESKEFDSVEDSSSGIRQVDNLDHIFIDDEYIDEIVSVLKRKKALILKGVPGVGKTFVIEDIIRYYFKNINENSIEKIQFHQSYAYEEFVEGLRPNMDGGYGIESGIFYDICTSADLDREHDYFLIIDEINRGNLSKIFGELMMLIENDKRDKESLILPYSKEKFTVPENLYIIGTMNTADRSLALVDYAMRRRFSFVGLEPAYNSPKFNNYLKDVMGLRPDKIRLINDRLTRVNEKIETRLGREFLLGHSYFIAKKEDIVDFEKWFKEIVKYELMPMVEEYFFDDEKTVEEIGKILGE